MKKTIAVDFDGVIHKYSKGWQDGSIYDLPHKGAYEALKYLKDLGFEIVIYSTRCYDRTVNGVLQLNQVEEMKKWLKQHHIVYDKIHTDPDKPLCVLFIDDNSYRFEGRWNTELPYILDILHPYLDKHYQKYKELGWAGFLIDYEKHHKMPTPLGLVNYLYRRAIFIPILDESFQTLYIKLKKFVLKFIKALR